MMLFPVRRWLCLLDCVASAITSFAAEFVHPGIFHSQQDLERLNASVADRGSQVSYTMQRPFTIFWSGGVNLNGTVSADCLSLNANSLLDDMM